MTGVLLRDATDEQIEQELQRRRFMSRCREAVAKKKPAVWLCKTCGATFTGGQMGGAHADFGQVWCAVCDPPHRQIDLYGDLRGRRSIPMERQP